MADAQPLIGRTITHYRVIEKLGGGGMGAVSPFGVRRLAAAFHKLRLAGSDWIRRKRR